jgi:hypothetical protein
LPDLLCVPPNMLCAPPVSSVGRATVGKAVACARRRHLLLRVPAAGLPAARARRRPPLLRAPAAGDCLEGYVGADEFQCYDKYMLARLK